MGAGSLPSALLSAPEPTHADGDLAAQLHRVRLESHTLYGVIGVVGSSPDLDRVLAGVVDLLTEATECHACLVYLRDGERLRLRAASPVYAHLVGRVEFGVDEGLAGWVARNRTPAFIRDDALSDPRTNYIPELEEERFQSMIAVPVPARSGEVIGVVVLHTVAPREFDEGTLNFLGHTASLVAGAIENAQLYEDTRRRVDALTTLSRLSHEIAAVSRREDLYGVVTRGIRALLGADVAELYLLDAATGRLELATSDPVGAAPLWPSGREAAVLLDLLRPRSSGAGGGARPAEGGQRDAPAVLAAAVAAGAEHLGVLAAARASPFGGEEDELLRAVANQAAVALKQAELIERLTEENIVRDMFEALAAGSADVAAARARSAGCDLGRWHVFAHCEPLEDDRRPWPAVAERTETRLRRLAPGAFCDIGRDRLRAVLPLRTEQGEELAALVGSLDALGADEPVLTGVSGVRRGAAGGRGSLGEAADAARIARALLAGGGALAYGDLGAYRYLVRIPAGDPPQDAYTQAVERLVEYDRRRRTQLVSTLEQYLRDRRSIAATARAMYVHPNTLRQRLDRIEQLLGFDLGDEDLLSLELAIKLVRLRSAPPAAGDGG